MRPEVQEYTVEEANKALVELKERKIRGAKVLRIDIEISLFILIYVSCL